MASTPHPIKHVVVMMFENRSFDSMLGFLYKDSNNKSPLGHPFEGLTGNEANPDSSGVAHKVFPIVNDNPYAYYMPKKDPGEGFANTNFQLFGAGAPPYPKGIAPNQGFVRDFENSIDNYPLEQKEEASSPPPATTNTAEPTHGTDSYAHHSSETDDHYEDYHSDHYKKWYKKSPPTSGLKIVKDFPGTEPKDIMGMYTPEMLPILSGLAKGYAVCDHWYCSVPSETLPNRAFTHMATSQGYLYDEVHVYTAKSIFAHLTDYGHTWGIFGNNGKPLTLSFCRDIPASPPPGSMAGSFDTFKSALANKTLPTYSFLEPVWGAYGTSQHPNYDVAAGEAYLQEIYEALKSSEYWEDTLLVITYDEHGGCYDHVTPPENAASPPAHSAAFGFDFTRFGVRVPTVLVSPWIEAGTVYRTSGSTPLDHTSILATLEELLDIPALTERDKAAPDVLDVLSLSKARTDDPLKGVKAPVADKSVKIPPHASQIQLMHAAALTSRHARDTVVKPTMPDFENDKDVDSYIDHYHHKYYGGYAD
jgi:phospholipase C